MLRSASTPLAPAADYERHRPEETPLYGIIETYYPQFLARLEADGASLPAFVKREFDDYLKCGRLEHGFLRVKCDACSHEHLVAFSCKRRGFCPSCGARRMVESAAHLLDHVLPAQPIRQWVLTFPYPLRFLFAAQPQVLGRVLGVVYRAISTHLLKRTGFTVASGAKTGAVTLIQRFGSALNLNIHFHMLFLDGAYSFEGSRPMFQRAPRPTPTELARLLHRIAQRVARLLERQGLLVRDPDRDYLDVEPGEVFDQLVGASVHYRIAIGPNAGRQALTLRTVPAQPEPVASTLLARQPGFSLHAATCCEANQRDKLEKLCRYIARPAIANERLSTNERGQIVYKFQQPFRDGTTHVMLEPLDLIARLAALVPRPRLNLTRFHGVFAPNCKHRESVVPKRKPGAEKPETPLAPMSWMQRLQRVFAIDIATCPKCGGKLRVIACIEDPDVIATILVHIQRRETAEPSQPRAPPRRSEHLDTPNQDRLFQNIARRWSAGRRTDSRQFPRFSVTRNFQAHSLQPHPVSDSSHPYRPYSADHTIRAVILPMLLLLPARVALNLFKQLDLS